MGPRPVSWRQWAVGLMIGGAVLSGAMPAGLPVGLSPGVAAAQTADVVNAPAPTPPAPVAITPPPVILTPVPVIKTSPAPAAKPAAPSTPASRKEAERKETARKEAERKDKERRDREQKERERKEKERKEEQRREEKRREEKRREEQRREEQKREDQKREEQRRKDREKREADRKHHAKASDDTEKRPARRHRHAPVAEPTPAPLAAPVAPQPVAKPAPHPVPPPARSLWDQLLYPVGIGFGLATELGALWLILRWRSRREQRAKDLAREKAKTILRLPAPPAPGPAEDAADTASPDMESDAPQEAIPLPTLRAAPRTRAPEHAAEHVTADAAHGPMPYAPPEEESPPRETARGATTETRGVFKPSSLFSRIDPIEPAPAAPLDPLAVQFEALRLTMAAGRIELRFRITLRNDSSGPLGPVRMAACMGTTEGDMLETAIEHESPRLMPGQAHVMTEEWRVALTQLPTLRLGSMRLMVGTARVLTSMDGDSDTPPGDATFLIGLPAQGGRLEPIPLDSATRIYENLGVQSASTQQA